MSALPWAAGPTTDPTVDRLRRDAAGLMARGGRWSPQGLVEGLQVVWGDQTPPVEWLDATLLHDPRLWRLPDGSWVHLLAVVGGRRFATGPAAPARRIGLLDARTDLRVALLPFAGWERIPVTTAAGRGVAEVGIAPDGGPVVVCPPDLLPDGPLVVVIPGPEGLHVAAGTVDRPADSRCRRTLARHLRDRRPVAADGPVPPVLPRPWTIADVLLTLLADDPSAARRPTTPLSTMLPEVLASLAADG